MLEANVRDKPAYAKRHLACFPQFTLDRFVTRFVSSCKVKVLLVEKVRT